MIDFTKEGKVGDKVRNLNGEIGAIKSLKHNETYPILVEYDGGNLQSYTATGKDHIYDRIPYIMFTNGSVTIDQGTSPEHVPKESESETYWRRFYPVTVGRVTTIDQDSQPEKLYCGLTKKQWQLVIDRRYQVEVSAFVGGIWEDGTYPRLRYLTDLVPEDYCPYKTGNETWAKARIPNALGILKPHFGGECPTNHDGLITVKLHNDAWINITLENGRDVWIWRKGDERSTDIMEYIELP